MTFEVKVIAKPVDALHCRLLVNQPVQSGPARRYRDAAEAGESAVATAVLCVPGIREVTIAWDEVAVVRREDGPRWHELAAPLRYAVITALTGARSAVLPSVPLEADDDAAFAVIDDIVRRQLNPEIAGHGGRIELVDVQDGVVVLRMAGGCQGCGMATVTLRQGVEATLRRAIPWVREIRDITDHAAGTKPYFARGAPGG